MAYDLLGLRGSTFKYESETAGGKIETKEHILDERDELWVYPMASVDVSCPAAFLATASINVQAQEECGDEEG